jgi:hypothetical protein
MKKNTPIPKQVRELALKYHINVNRDHNGIYAILDRDGKPLWHFQSTTGVMAGLRRFIRARYSTSKNPRKKKVKSNPGQEIYRDITYIEGTKGPDSQYPGQKFYHRFKKPYPRMIAGKDGSLIIRSKR